MVARNVPFKTLFMITKAQNEYYSIAYITVNKHIQALVTHNGEGRMRLMNNCIYCTVAVHTHFCEFTFSPAHRNCYYC